MSYIKNGKKVGIKGGLMEIKVIDGKLNVDLKPGDKILSDSRLVGKRKYIFQEVSKDKEYRLLNEENCKVVVGVNWFNNGNKRTFLLEEE